MVKHQFTSSITRLLSSCKQTQHAVSAAGIRCPPSRSCQCITWDCTCEV